MALKPSPVTQSPAGYSAQNLQGNQLAARMAGTASAAQRANLATAIQDSGYRYLIHPAETAAGLTAVNLAFGFDPGDLRRYKCTVDGSGDNTANINNAIAAATAAGGWNYILNPNGIIAFASQITIPSNLAVLGISRSASEYRFTGTPAGSPAATRSAFRYTGVAPWSGYANVMFRHCKINYVNAINFAAAIELSAWGWSYWDIYDVWVTGGCSYGIVLDGTEICSVHNCLIENTNATANTNIWIVNGADRGFTQGTGFSNVITIRDNQISCGVGAIGLVDDGGNAHVIQGNNFNQGRFLARFAGCTALQIAGNSFETTLITGSSNVDFEQTSNAGNGVGPCVGFTVSANGFFGSMQVGSSAQLFFGGVLNTVTGVSKAASAVVTVSTVSAANPFVVGQFIYFSGLAGMTQLNGLGGTVTAIGGASGAWTATFNINTSGFGVWTAGGQAFGMHSAGSVKGNVFGDVLGRGSAIDVTFLANSECACNTDLAKTGGASHYNGVHTDSNSNLLLPPTNGFTGGSGLGTASPTFGDTRFKQLLIGGLSLVSGSLSPSNDSLGSQSGQVFQGVGVPSNANGSNGDVYFRTDTPGTAMQRVYMKSAGVWVGIV